MIEIIPNWHPILVHFTAALLTVAAVLYLFAAMLSAKSASREQMNVVARWNLWLGFLISLGTAVAGFYAFDTVTHDDVSHAAMKLHRNFAIGTLAAFVPFVIASAIDAMRNRLASGAFAFALLVPTALLVATAWRGSELVYRYGLGVKSLPNVEAHHHEQPSTEGTPPAADTVSSDAPAVSPPSSEVPATAPESQSATSVTEELTPSGAPSQPTQQMPSATETPRQRSDTPARDGSAHEHSPGDEAAPQEH